MAHTIVTASDDETARLWDAAQQPGAAPTRRPYGRGLVGGVSPDAALVTASGDRTARIWDAASGEELRQLGGHTDRVTWAAFSRTAGPSSPPVAADRPRLPCRHADRPVELRQLEGHTAAVTSAAYSPNGRRIVTASASTRPPRILFLQTGVELRQLDGHTAAVTSAAYGSPTAGASSHRQR